MLVGMSDQQTARDRSKTRITIELDTPVYRRLAIYKVNAGGNIKDFVGKWITERLAEEERKLASS